MSTGAANVDEYRFCYCLEVFISLLSLKHEPLQNTLLFSFFTCLPLPY